VYKDFINDPKKARIFEAWHFLLEDNLNLDPQYIEDVKASYSGVFFDRMIRGLFVVAEGLIFEEYKPEEHIINSYSLSDYKEFMAGVDFGFANPSALYLIGVTRQNEFHIIREFYEKNKLNIDLINWIKAQQQDIGRKINFIYCDSAEPDRIKEMQLKGLSAYKADKEVLASLNTGKTLFKRNKIKIYKDCINLQNELQTLRWAEEGETGYGDEKHFVGDDHGIDAAVRYAIHTYSKKILHYR
jgi:phage terminase large subunit